MHTNMSLSIK